MILRYVYLLMFLMAVNTSWGQGSIMQEVSYPFLDTLIAAAKANYPRVKIYQRRVHTAELNVQRNKLDWFNIVYFTYLYNPSNNRTLINQDQTNSNLLLNGYQVGVTTSIGTILQKPGAIKMAKDDLDIAELTQEEYLNSLESTVKKLYFSYLQSVEMLKWRSKSLESTESITQEAKYKFEKGEETFDGYTKILDYYRSAVQSKYDAEMGLISAKNGLEEIIGVKLEKLRNGIQ